MKISRSSGLFDRIAEAWKTAAKTRQQLPGAGGHTAGRRRPHNYRVQLNKKRKAQRQARRRARMQLAGRKHRK